MEENLASFLPRGDLYNSRTARCGRQECESNAARFEWVTQARQLVDFVWPGRYILPRERRR